MIELIESFGGYKALQIILLILCSLFLFISFFKNKIIRFFLSLFSSFFLSAQLVSLYSTQSFINYQFYYHFNLDGITGLSGLFTYHFIYLALIFLLLFILLFKSYKLLFFIKNKKIKKNTIHIVSTILIFLCSGYIYSNNDFMDNIRSLKPLFNKNLDSFDKVLYKNKMSSYVKPQNIVAKPGKNIIILSLESLEKGFLTEKHQQLTPHLISYKNNWNYYPIDQNVGSGWTSGSMYTCLTGFPAFFGKKSNRIFATSYNSKLTSISNTLKTAGYQTSYMNGNTRHSGTRDMLKAFSFDRIIDYENSNIDSNLSKYGLRDKDLFDLAKKEVLTLADSNKPFALFVSTTDTHFPDGIYDKRMEKNISPQKSNLEFMVSALDYLVGDFIEYLKVNNLFENTSIYIFPDHLKMGSPNLFKDTGKRGLYLITTANKKDIGIKKDDQLYQIDLAKMILNGAQVKHNQKFLTEYINGNKDEFLRKNINTITELNTSGLQRQNEEEFVLPKKSKNYKNYKKDNSRYIAHAGGMINGDIYTNSLEALNYNYNKGFRLFELDIVKSKEDEFLALHDWDKWKSMTDYNGKTPVDIATFKKYKILNKYTPISIKEINEWFKNHPDAILVTDKINEPKLFSESFIDPSRLIMELFSEKAIEEASKTNILSAMPTQSTLSNMQWDSLIKLNVKYAAVSRFFIAENKAFLQKLKENNIKVFVYHINQDGDVLDSGIDEEYVTKYELDYVYGMYADKWNFE